MTKKDILNRAIYMQFPLNNEKYFDYSDHIGQIIKFPIVKEKNIMYTGLPQNEHHYTTYYHRKYVLPKINESLGFGYNETDFDLIKNMYVYNNKTFDFSYLKSKMNYMYSIFCMERNLYIKNVKITELINNKNNANMKTPYHLLCSANHEPSVITNETIKNDRKLLISGDSQMIPSILPLANYYKQIFYMDNRTGFCKNADGKIGLDINKTTSYRNQYENVDFNDIIIVLWANRFSNYTEINLC